MIKQIAGIIIIPILIFTLSSCKDAITNPPPVTPDQDFFPDDEGTIYNYDVSVYSNATLTQSGLMKTYYGTDTLIQSVPYRVRVDSLQLNGTASVGNLYFRKSNSGIFYYVDTTGIAEFIPDSLLSFVDVDLEYRLLYQPLETTQTWPVYRIQVAGLGINVLTIDAKSVLKDSLDLTLPNLQTKKLVHQVHYAAVITVSTTQPPLTFEAFAWFAEDIGIIKWEGDAEMLNFLFGENIFPDGTTVLMELSLFEHNG